MQVLKLKQEAFLLKVSEDWIDLAQNSPFLQTNLTLMAKGEYFRKHKKRKTKESSIKASFIWTPEPDEKNKPNICK